MAQKKGGKFDQSYWLKEKQRVVMEDAQRKASQLRVSAADKLAGQIAKDKFQVFHVDPDKMRLPTSSDLSSQQVKPLSDAIVKLSQSSGKTVPELKDTICRLTSTMDRAYLLGNSGGQNGLQNMVNLINIASDGKGDEVFKRLNNSQMLLAAKGPGIDSIGVVNESHFLGDEKFCRAICETYRLVVSVVEGDEKSTSQSLNKSIGLVVSKMAVTKRKTDGNNDFNQPITQAFSSLYAPTVNTGLSRLATAHQAIHLMNEHPGCEYNTLILIPKAIKDARAVAKRSDLPTKDVGDKLPKKIPNDSEEPNIDILATVKNFFRRQ